MATFTHDWPRLLPRINKMRVDGMGNRAIAESLGIPESSFRKGMDFLKASGEHVEPSRNSRAGTYQQSGPILEKLIQLIPRGMSRAEMAAEIGVKVGAIYYVMTHRLTEEQRREWQRAQGKLKPTLPKKASSPRRSRTQMIAKVETPDEARRREVFSATIDREKAAPLLHKECEERAQKITQTFQPRRRASGESHPAMPPGGIAWAAIWNGNPPPYPHGMMKGRFS